ncbi:MAG: hypothetical protein GY927_02710 [bacterium]|nr:hypothetical protein [bacterium]
MEFCYWWPSAIGLGSCRSAMDYSSSISEQEIFRIGKLVTPVQERTRLIKQLTKANRDHHARAFDEIAVR